MTLAERAASLALYRSRLIEPFLHGLDPGVQGAVLAELTSKWLAGHPRQFRDVILETQIDTIRKLTPISEQQLFGDAGHPGNAP